MSSGCQGHAMLWQSPWRVTLTNKCSVGNQMYVRNVGAENMFPFWSELHCKTLYEVRGYFVQSSGLLCTKFGYLIQTSCKHRPNFVQTSAQFSRMQYILPEQTTSMKHSLHYLKIGKVCGRICKHCQNFQMETFVEMIRQKWISHVPYGSI